MRRVARFLIRLYPANWRERYGEEFEALLEDSTPGWPAVFDLLQGVTQMQLSVPTFQRLAVHRNLNEFLLQLQTGILSRTSLSNIIQEPPS